MKFGNFEQPEIIPNISEKAPEQLIEGVEIINPEDLPMMEHYVTTEVESSIEPIDYSIEVTHHKRMAYLEAHGYLDEQN